MLSQVTLDTAAHHKVGSDERSAPLRFFSKANHPAYNNTC